MNWLTEEEKDHIITMPRYQKIENTSEEDVILWIRKAIERHSDAVQILNWIEKIEVKKFKSKEGYYAIKSHHYLNFKARTLVFTYGGWKDSLDYIDDVFNDWYDDLDTKLHNGWISIENALPYKMEDLFYGRKPHYRVDIEEHFNHENFAYVKTYVYKPNPKKQTRKSKSRDLYKEMVIEQFVDREGRISYKTKIHTYLDQFRSKKDQMSAPKADKIEVIIEEKRSRYGSTISKGKEKDLIKIKKVDDKNSVVVTKDISFRASGLVLDVVYTPFVKYNDGKLLWLVIREDEYNYDLDTNEFANVSFKHFSFFYEINEYGGIAEVADLNTIDIEKDSRFDKSKLITEEPPVMETVKFNDVSYPVILPNEDETDLIVLDHYEYLTIEKKNWSPEAVEFTIKNNTTQLEKLVYYAKYDGKYVQTMKWNPKVKELLEMKNIFDILESV